MSHKLELKYVHQNGMLMARRQAAIGASTGGEACPVLTDDSYDHRWSHEQVACETIMVKRWMGCNIASASPHHGVLMEGAPRVGSLPPPSPPTTAGRSTHTQHT